MDFPFTDYLLAKQSVDDRALNRNVFDCLRTNLSQENPRIIEVGAGIGTMLKRLIKWGLFTRADYIMVDEMAENIGFANSWIPTFATELGWNIEWFPDGRFRIYDVSHDVRIQLVGSDVFDFIKEDPAAADLLIAHAFLDLLPMPDSLSRLIKLIKPEGLAWLTINFDGVTILEPIIDASLDEKIQLLYHQTMDIRPSGGDSQAGRHLFRHLVKVGAQIITAGASDWVVHAKDGKYPFDEEYFLNFIIHFFEESLAGCPELDQEIFSQWLSERKAQIQRGEIVYIAHQIDLLAKL